jgi:hypothetical protein
MRLVYCLRFELETPPPTSRALIVWLNADGNFQPEYARPMDRGKRVVDVGPGDRLWHRGQISTVRSVAPYRWHDTTEESLQGRQNPPDGFLMP